MTLILLLVVIAAVIALPLILVARRRTKGTGTSAVEIVTYLVLVAASVLTTNAISSLLEMVMPGDGVLVRQADDLALTLATLIVAGIVWLTVWMALERRIGGSPSPGRGLYVSVTASIAMAVTAAATIRLLLAAIGDLEFEASGPGDLIAFGGLWALVAWLRRPVDPLDQLRLLWGSWQGLVLTVTGAAFILATSLGAIIDSGRLLAGADNLIEGLLRGSVLLVVGVPFLVWFWFRRLAKSESTARDLYAGLVAGIGWFAGVVALGAIVYQLARALFGIGAELSDVPGWLTTFVLGGLTYWHHRVVLGAARTEKVRILEYIFGGAGLVSSASAIVTLAAIAIDNLTGSAVIDGESGEVVTAAVVALVVSAAVVIRFWGRGLQLSGEPAEVASPARRTVTIVLLFGAAITGVGALIGVLFVLLRAAIAGETSQMSEGLSIGIPIVAVAGVLCWHLVGLRRQATPPAAREAVAGVVSRGTRTVTIVASDPGPLPQMIEKMRFLKRSDGVGLVDDLQAEEIIAAVDRADGTSLLVTVGGDGFQVVPLA